MFRLFLLSGLALAACHEDPLGGLDGTPGSVTLSFASLTLDEGTSATVTASVVDTRAVPLTEPVTFTTRDASIATAVLDPDYQPVPATSARAIVQATGLGVTYVVATGGGVKDSVRVETRPLAFAGALSGTTVPGGTQLTIASTAALKFDPATVAVSFPGIGAAPIISSTADTVKVLAPFGATPGPLTIDGIAVTYVPGLTVSLSTTASVTVTGDWVLSSTTPTGGDTLAVASTANLKFSDTTDVVLAGFGALPVVSRTPDTVKVLAAFSAGQLTITNVDVTFAPGLVVSLATAAIVHPTGDTWAAANDWPTAPDITSLLPASGQSSVILATIPGSNPAGICPEDRFRFGPSGKCAMFKFTLAAPTTITFSTDWDGPSTDVDIVVCSDSALVSYDTTFTTFSPCGDDGLSGATSAKPEVAGGVLYAAGTYWFVVQDFEGTGVTNYVVTISEP